VEERKIIKEKKNRKRENFERNNCGDFELIFPSTNIDLMAKYDRFIDGAQESINKHQGTVKRNSYNYEN